MNVHGDQNGPSPSAAWGGHEGTLGMLRAVNACLRRWRLFVYIPLLIAAAAVALTVTQPARYTARGTIMPQGGSSEMGMSGLAQRFGFAMPGASNTVSPEFYVLLMRSDGLLRQLVDAEYQVGDPLYPAPVSLAELFGVEAEVPAVRVEEAITALRDRLAVSVDDKTGVVRLAATTRWPELSQRLADDLIQLVHEFNIERRQTQGGAESAFTERRLEQAGEELEEAQDALTAFQRTNRGVQNSPELLAESRRLMAQLEFRQQVYLSLAQAFEQAKIEAVRNTPMITVIDRPGVPAREDPKNVLSTGLLGLLLGVVLAGAWAISADYLRRLDSERAEPISEFRLLARSMGSDLRRGPLGWVGVRSGERAGR